MGNRKHMFWLENKRVSTIDYLSIW